MGNTYSTTPNTLLFSSPYTSARHRLSLFQKADPDLTLPNPCSLSPPPLHCTSRPPPLLKCYKVLPPSAVLAPLHKLCTLLHTSGPMVYPTGFKPVTIFLLKGDFANPKCNSMISVLIGQKTVYIREDGTEDITGRHGWIHIYEPGFAAAGFDEVFSEMKDNGEIEDIEVKVEESTVKGLEGVALFWPRAVWEGLIEEGEGFEVEGGAECVLEGLEDWIWRIWLGVDAGGEQM